MNKVSPLRNIFVASSGTMLEFYDFTLYGVFAVVFSTLFFPDNDYATLYSLLIYALGSFLRPLGGLLFGYLADIKGRKFSLLVSILIMSTATFAMGLIPVYQDIGVFSLFFLLLFRCLQGFSAGGEFNNTTIYALESNDHRPGLYSGTVVASATIGTLVAVVLSGLVLKTQHPSAWRIPFLLGGVLGYIGFFFRRYIHESPVFETEKKSSSLFEKVKTLLKHHKRSLLMTISIGGYASTLGFTIFNYINIYLNSVIHFDASDSILLSSIGIGGFIIFTPLFGAIADRIGPLKLMVGSGALCFLSSYIIYLGLSSAVVWKIMLAQLFLTLLSSSMSGSMHLFLVKLFPSHLRCLGISLGFTLGIAMFGGTMPFFSNSLIELTNNILSPSFYLMICSFALLYLIYPYCSVKKGPVGSDSAQMLSPRGAV